jgi:hypothetical protein
VRCGAPAWGLVRGQVTVSDGTGPLPPSSVQGLNGHVPERRRVVMVRCMGGGEEGVE